MTQQETSMRRSGWILIAIGTIFALSALPMLHPLTRTFLQIAYWPVNQVPADLVVPIPLLVAISGGLTVGFGGLLWALGTYVAPLSPEAASKVTWVTAWSWFCTDSTISIFVGAPFNAVLNLTFLALMLLSCRPKAGAGPASSERVEGIARTGAGHRG